MDARAAINMPIIQDVLAARLVVNKETYDGFFTNRLNGKKIGKQDRLTLRGTIVITPTDNLDINLKAFLVRDRSSAPGGDTGPARNKLLWLIYGFEEPDDGAFTIGRDFSANHDTDQLGFIGNVGLDLGSWQAKSITGYIETDDFNDSDFDQSEIFFFPTYRLQSHRQFSQELRLQSDFSDRSDALARLSLVFGGYYLNQSFELAQAFPTLPVLHRPAELDVRRQAELGIKGLFPRPYRNLAVSCLFHDAVNGQITGGDGNDCERQSGCGQGVQAGHQP